MLFVLTGIVCWSSGSGFNAKASVLCLDGGGWWKRDGNRYHQEKKNHRKLPIRHSKMIIFQTVRARSQLWILKTIKEMKLTFFSRFCLVASNFFSVFSSGRVFLWSGVHSVNQNGDHDEVTERNGTSERMKEKKIQWRMTFVVDSFLIVNSLGIQFYFPPQQFSDGGLCATVPELRNLYTAVTRFSSFASSHQQKQGIVSRTCFIVMPTCFDFINNQFSLRSEVNNNKQ